MAQAKLTSEFPSSADRSQDIERIRLVEKHTGSTLPTSVVSSLTASDISDADLVRYAKMVSRSTSVPLQQFFVPLPSQMRAEGDTRHPLFVDFTTGRLTSFDDARRLYKVYKPEAIKALLPHVGADPKRVASVFAGLSGIKGGNADFAPLLALARDIANTPLNLKLLKDNLRVISEAPGLFPGTGISPVQALLIARKATSSGVRFGKPTDILAFLSPDMKNAIKQQQAARAAMKADPRYQQIQRLGDPNSPEYEPDSHWAETWQQLNNRGELYAADIFGGNEFVPKLLESLQNDENDYIKVGNEMVAQMRKDAMVSDTRNFDNVANAWAEGNPLAVALAGGLFVGSWIALGASKALNAVGDAWNFMFQRTVGAAARVVLGPELNPAFGLVAEERERKLSDAFKDARDIFMGRTTYAEELEKEGVPPWLTTSVEITLSFVADPFLLVLKGVGAARRARALYTLLEDGKSLESYLSKGLATFDERLKFEGIGKATLPEAFVQATLSSDKPELAFLRVNDRLRQVYDRPGLHPALATAMFDYIRAADRAGTSAAQLASEVRWMLLEAHGIKPPASEAGLSNFVRQRFESARLSASEDLSRLTGEATDDLLTAQERYALAKVDDYEALLQSNGGFVSLELPSITKNPVTKFLLNRRRGALADTEVGGLLRAATVTAPRRSVNEFLIQIDDPRLTDSVVAVAKRSRLFDNAELAKIELKVGQYMNRALPAREVRFRTYLEGLQKEMLTRLRKSANATEDQLQMVLDMIERDGAGRVFGSPSPLQDRYGGVFGVVSGQKAGESLTIFTQPVFSTQLQNEYKLLDPIIVRHTLNQSMGYFREFRNFLIRSLNDIPLATGKLNIPIPEARSGAFFTGSENLDRLTSRKIWERVFGFAMRDVFATLWKPLAVIRPAYVMRVVLGEEQMRFLASRGLMERLETLPGRSRFVKDAEVRFGQRGNTMLIQLEEGVSKEAVEQAFGPNSGVIVREMGEGLVEVFRPFRSSAAIPDISVAAAADATGSAIALAGTTGPMSAAALARSGGRVRFDPIPLPLKDLEALRAGKRVSGKDLTEYLNGWAHSLNYQFANDPMGATLLRHILDGVDRETSVRLLADAIEAQRGKRGELWSAVTRTLEARNPSATDIELLIERQLSIIDQYTLGRDAKMAEHALSGGLSADVLKQMVLKPDFDIARLPLDVYGPQLDLLTAAAGQIKRGAKAYSDLILRIPTTHLSRRPFAKSWMKVYKDAAYSVLESQGVVKGPELIKAVEKQAEMFAKRQVDRIMFDFTRQARLGEALDFIYPFVQPFAEQFAVWARLLKQNPAAIGYIRATYKAGLDSGFLRRDEDGQIYVPLSAWLGATPFLETAFGLSGWRLSAPLNSFNTFFQQSIPLNLGGVTLPILTPGMSPPAQWLAQQFLKSDAAGLLLASQQQMISRYVMSYGPITLKSLIPPYLRYLAGPTLVDQSTVDRYKIGFLRSYAAKQFRLPNGQEVGLTEVNLAAHPDFARMVADRTFKNEQEAAEWLDAKAEDDVRELLLYRSFMLMFFPAAPMIELPSREWETELRALRADPQYEGDYLGLQEEWLRRHPDGMVFLITKTAPMETKDGVTPPVAANPLADQIFMTDGGRQFLKDHPSYAWAIIPREIREASNISSWFTNIAMNRVRVRTGPETLELTAIRRGWDDYRAIKEWWVAWQDQNPDASSTSLAYRNAEMDLYTEPLNALRTRNPLWAADFSTYENQSLDPLMLEEARNLAEDEKFSQTELGKALGEFLPAMDRIRAAMSYNAISNITDAGAKTLGLDKEWEQLLADLKERYPDFGTWAYVFDIDNALKGVENDANVYLNSLPEAQQKQMIADYTRYADVIEAASDAESDADRTQFYNARAPMVAEFYDTYPADKTPLHVWWGGLTPYSRQNYLNSWSAYPILWLDRFQKEQLGITSDTATETILADYNNAVADVQARYDRGELSRDQRSEYLKSYTLTLANLEKTNPLLREQVAIDNTWGYLFFKAHPTYLSPENPGAESWGLLLDKSQMLMRWTYAADIYGAGDYNDKARAWYSSMMTELRRYVNEELKPDNPIFAQQWDDLKESLGGVETFGIFLPEYTGRLGSGTYLTDWTP